MIKPINDNNYFNEEQIKRIYEVYEFGDDEEIEAAWYEDGQLYVDYSSPTGGNVYMPSIDDESDDIKIKYILTGDTSGGKISDYLL